MHQYYLVVVKVGVVSHMFSLLYSLSLISVVAEFISGKIPCLTVIVKIGDTDACVTSVAAELSVYLCVHDS